MLSTFRAYTRIAAAAVLMALPGLASAQSYYDDDIYFDDSRVEKKVKVDNKAKMPKTANTTNTNTRVVVSDFPAADTYTYDSGSMRDVDEYNRRGQFLVSDTVYSEDEEYADDFANTRRIERFHNSEVVSGSDDDDLQVLYYSSQPATVNIYVNDPWYYPSWSVSIGSPMYAWNSWYSWNTWNRWNWSWGWGFYDPWWGPAWGPGWDPYWGHAWHHGWDPCWHHGWDHGWGPGHGPGHGWRPEDNWAWRPSQTSSGSYLPHRPASSNSMLRPSNNGNAHRPSGNQGVRPSDTNGRVTNVGTRPSRGNSSSLERRGDGVVTNRHQQNTNVGTSTHQPARTGTSTTRGRTTNTNRQNSGTTHRQNSGTTHRQSSGSSFGQGSFGGGSFGGGGMSRGGGGGSHSGGGGGGRGRR